MSYLTRKPYLSWTDVRPLCIFWWYSMWIFLHFTIEMLMSLIIQSYTKIHGGALHIMIHTPYYLSRIKKACILKSLEFWMSSCGPKNNSQEVFVELVTCTANVNPPNTQTRSALSWTPFLQMRTLRYKEFQYFACVHKGQKWQNCDLNPNSLLLTSALSHQHNHCTSL